MPTTKKLTEPPEEAGPEEASLWQRWGKRYLWLAAPLLAVLGLYLGLSTQPRDPALGAFREGLRWLREGRPEQAAPLFRTAAKLWETNAPAAARAWNYVGLAYHEAGQYAAADEAYRAAALMDPDLLAARFNRGRLQLDHGSIAEAIRELEAFIAYRPQHALGRLYLGEALFRAGRLAEARTNLIQAVRFAKDAPTRVRAMNDLAVCLLQQGGAEQARKLLKAAAALDPKNPDVLWNQAALASREKENRLETIEKLQAYLDAAQEEPRREEITRLMHQLAVELRPGVESPSGVPGLRSNLAGNVSNLFAQVGAVRPGGLRAPAALKPENATNAAEKASPPPETNAPPKPKPSPPEAKPEREAPPAPQPEQPVKPSPPQIASE
ncbi:MAG: tetratricopeptide repeat protein, partial [Verrucomicrobia bacterium]|nr:tetratricopeptide repeat protein [Verrucomicrobiota bacterium]